MRRFYAPPENFSNHKVVLGFEESKHLRDVLRLREESEAFVFDGSGREFRCKIESIGKRETVLNILEQVTPKSPESNLNLTLAVALLKGEKFDLVIQKTCELGVSRIVPLQTKRADVKIKDAKEIEKKLERWRRIALAAVKQSGRARLMQIDALVSFENFIETASGTRLLFSERNGAGLEELGDRNAAVMTAVVGAEGGWEDSEIEGARRKGFHIITLGGRILRAETSAIVVSAVLQNHFGDLR
jgi:16S rRNA (uracil1498-N3)-methyltransferase